MHRPCLDAPRILAASKGEALGADEQQHLEACARCQEGLAEVLRITVLLKNLGEAERGSLAPGRLWPGVEARLEAPGLTARLPLSLAGLSRLTQEVLRPSVAAAWAAGVVGLLFGIWLAPRSPSVEPEEPYNWSSLVEDRVSLSAVYESSFGGEASGVEWEPEREAPASGDDSSGTGESRQDGGQP